MSHTNITKTTTIVVLSILAGSLVAPRAEANEQPFLKPPQYVGPPQALHAVTHRAFQGIPSLAVSPGGRLWATWYAGVTPGEDHNNYVVLSTSGDQGATWQEVLVADPDADGPVRAFDPELWMAPDGKLRWVWAQAIGHSGAVAGVWFLDIANPDAGDPPRTAPRRVTDGIMMCKPIVLSTGEWVLPVSTWRDTDHSARMVVSTDQGKTWSVRGACHVPVAERNYDEHMLIERKDGSLWMLVRTKYGIGESVSTDRGRTWSELAPSSIPHPPARFFISRLNSGNLLLVKHGSMEERTGRSHLTAFVSRDDGKTWVGGLLLDERRGVSYPDGQQTSDGLIHIIYDYNRTHERHILMATFREEDVAAGKDTSGAVRLRQLVSEASGGKAKEEPQAATKPHNINAAGTPLRTGSAAAHAAEEPTPPPLNFQPGPEYADAARQFQGIPSIARAPGGRLWAAWYGGGTREGPENYIMLATSHDQGDTWSDLKLVVDPPFRASEPGLWCDPAGRLWLALNLYPQGLTNGNTQLWVITTDHPDAENPTWSKPRLLARDLNNFNKPIVLADGTWLWPAGNWWKGRDLLHPSRPLLSTDGGLTFEPGGAILIPPEVREYDEYNAVQLRDGRLWLLTRTKAGPYEAFSSDGGRTWTNAKPRPTIPHNVSRHFLTRLNSGRLLLVKHGDMDRRIGRSNLMAFVSEDDGNTWLGGLLLDERQCSYPDGCQAPDGTIYIIYDHERTRACQILLARFTEQDVLAGKLVSPGAALKRVVNDAAGRPQPKPRQN